MISKIHNANDANRLLFSRNAINYLQDGKIKEDSLGKQVKDSAVGSLPFATVFGAGIPALQAIKHVKKHGGKFLDVLQEQLRNSKKPATKEPGKLARLLRLDKLSNWFKGTKLGSTKLMQGLSKLNLGSWFAFNMLFQCGEIIPAFANSGPKEGFKQLGKSLAVASVDAVAYAGGMKLGITIGTAVGGPIGGVIGAVGGMILGGVATTIGSNICKKLVGKSYNEKTADLQKEKLAQEYASDDLKMLELKQQIEQAVEQKAQNSRLNAHDKEILKQAQSLSLFA